MPSTCANLRTHARRCSVGQQRAGTPRTSNKAFLKNLRCWRAHIFYSTLVDRSCTPHFFLTYPFPSLPFLFSLWLSCILHTLCYAHPSDIVLSSQQCTIPLLLTVCSRLSCITTRTLFVPLDICHIHIDLDLDSIRRQRGDTKRGYVTTATRV